MKKALAIIILSIFMACTLLPLAAFADGAVLWTDDFSTMAENDWIWDGDLFFISNGKLEGWAEAVVHQSNFLVDRGAPRRFKECAFKVDAAGLEDGGQDSEYHGLSLWFADYISPNGDNEPDGQIVYTFGYEFESHTLKLNAAFDNAGEDYMPAGADGSVTMAEYVVPEAEAPELDTSGKSVFTLGMRINGGVISCFFNDMKVIEMTGYRGATTCTQLGSPILFINGGCHCTWDNLIATTADYDLFNEAANGGQQGGGQQGGQQGGAQGGAQQGGGTEKVIVS